MAPKRAVQLRKNNVMRNRASRQPSQNAFAKASAKRPRKSSRWESQRLSQRRTVDLSALSEQGFGTRARDGRFDATSPLLLAIEFLRFQSKTGVICPNSNLISSRWLKISPDSNHLLLGARLLRLQSRSSKQARSNCAPR